MKRRRKITYVSVAIVILLASWLWSIIPSSPDPIRVHFIGMTNDPSLGPAAVLCVTNQAVSLIGCAKLATQAQSASRWIDVNVRSPSGLAYLECGESYMFAVPVPAGSGPWRVPVLWQRRELSRFETFLNRQRSRWLVFLGEADVHRDPWVPFAHVVYSPEMHR